MRNLYVQAVMERLSIREVSPYDRNRYEREINQLVCHCECYISLRFAAIGRQGNKD